MKTWLIALTVAASLGAADLDSVKREPDLEIVGTAGDYEELLAGGHGLPLVGPGTAATVHAFTDRTMGSSGASAGRHRIIEPPREG